MHLGVAPNVVAARGRELGAEFRAVGLDLTNPELSFDEYEGIGRILGDISAGWRWNIGDWLIVGEALFGEEAAQAVEDRACRNDLARWVPIPVGTSRAMESERPPT